MSVGKRSRVLQIVNMGNTLESGVTEDGSAAHKKVDEVFVRDRIKAAILGMFIGDSLGMPVHWYYDPEKLNKAYGRVTDYEDAKHPHEESFLAGMSYNGTLNILHDHAKFYKTAHKFDNEEKKSEDTEKAEDEEQAPGDGEEEQASGDSEKDAPDEKPKMKLMEHGNFVPNEPYHYHHGMKAGDNTVDISIIRVLLRSINEKKGYMNDDFLEAFKGYMTTPGINTDVYTSVYIRKFFENASRGLELYNCGQRQYENWSVIHSTGTFGAFVVALLNHRKPAQALARAIQHHNTTHRAENITMALVVLIPLILDLINGANPNQRLRSASKQVYMPKLSGVGIRERYRAAKGPGNIPKDEMWRIHTELQDEPMDIDKFLPMDDVEFVRNTASTICYTEFSVPSTMYLAIKYCEDFENALVSSTNCGGDTCGRNGILGAVMGASVGMDGIPDRWVKGLIHHDEIEKEIDGFVDLCFA